MTDPLAGRPVPPLATGRDLGRILIIQGIRAWVYGFGAVLVGTELAAGGLTDLQVASVFTAMLAGMAIASIAVGLRGHRLGRRALYRALLLVMGAAGMVFAVTRWLPALLLASLTGTLSTDPNESGPITSIEQVMIGEAPAPVRLRTFGRYNAVAYLAGAAGSLAAGAPSAVRRLVPAVPSDERFLFVFPVLAVVCGLVSRGLSPGVEPAQGERAPLRAPLVRSRGTVARLSALFALDAGAGGFVVQAFLAFWLRRRFGAGPELIGSVLAIAGVLQAGSSIVAARLGARIGLLNTMVFTHLPSNVALGAVAFAPNLVFAVALLLLRSALSQMDVPARQAYVIAMVEPGERTAAASFTNSARYVVRPAGAAGAGVLMQHVEIGAPFLVSGALKIVYDVALYLTFRRVPLPEDVPAPRSPDTQRSLGSG